jgi:hypothetical protein
LGENCELLRGGGGDLGGRGGPLEVGRAAPRAGSAARGIDENAVDFKPTYDGQDEEPVVLPIAFIFRRNAEPGPSSFGDEPGPPRPPAGSLLGIGRSRPRRAAWVLHDPHGAVADPHHHAVHLV